LQGQPTNAVGWTQYVLDHSLTIIGAHVFLDEDVFSAGQQHNETALEYGFRLALHELGRVLGLGSLVDGLDIMNPIGTAMHAGNPPLISMIDLFALHVLASKSFFYSPIVLNTDQDGLVNVWNILGFSPNNQTGARFDGFTITCPVRTMKFSLCYG
jgi:hypothetical protein